jgi:hypothetical protein
VAMVAEQFGPVSRHSVKECSQQSAITSIKCEPAVQSSLLEPTRGGPPAEARAAAAGRLIPSRAAPMRCEIRAAIRPAIGLRSPPIGPSQAHTHITCLCLCGI